MYFFTLQFLETAVISFIIFILMDCAWSGLIARKIYFRNLAYLAVVNNGKIKFKLKSGIAAKVIISLAITSSVFMSILVGGRICWAVSSGGFAGFAIYAAYNLTCHSFIKNWPPFISLLDIAWGTLQGMLAGIYVFYITGILTV